MQRLLLARARSLNPFIDAIREYAPPNPSWRHLTELQALDSGLLLTSHCSNINLLVKKLVLLCIDSPNTLCCRNFLLHRGLLIVFSEDPLCIKELEELPLLLNSEYQKAWQFLYSHVLHLQKLLEPLRNRFHLPT